MSGDDYLTDYRRSVDSDLSRGIGGYIRRQLDNIAIRLGQPDRHALFLPRVFDLFGLSLERELSVIEIGCGSGWAISYRHPKIRYLAVDRGSVFRDELEGRGVEFHEADVATTPLPVANGSVDLILLNHIIEHIANSEFFGSELRRILRPGGHLYIRTPNLARVQWAFWDDHTHVKPFTVHSLDHFMRITGFQRRFMLHSDHARMMFDVLTRAHFRRFLFGRLLGGKEIEAGYVLR